MRDEAVSDFKLTFEFAFSLVKLPKEKSMKKVRSYDYILEIRHYSYISNGKVRYLRTIELHRFRVIAS